MAAATTDDAFLLAECETLPEFLRRRSAFRVVPEVRPGSPAAAAAAAATARPATRAAGRPAPTAVPVRLTRRGIAVLTAAALVVTALLVGLAWLSAPAAAGGAADATVATVTGPTVQVAPGDSLWSIAGRVAPDTDPRAEVAVLQRLNHLAAGAQLQPGDVLRVR